MLKYTQVPKFFLDSGNPKDTTASLEILKSFSATLYGQTTNPSLVTKNPVAQQKIKSGQKFTEAELMDFYKQVIIQISSKIPQGSVSIEVYADKDSTTKDLLIQAEDMYTWIPNAHIKFPTTLPGLEAAQSFVDNGGRVNMTLVFTQEQALAVHLATQSATQKGQVFLSPFIGRLDDISFRGLDLIANVREMYNQLNSKVEILAASIRTPQHALGASQKGSDILTLPYKVIQGWKDDTSTFPSTKNLESFKENPSPNLKPIDYQILQQTESWKDINISHQLTTKGLQGFADDWNSLIG